MDIVNFLAEVWGFSLVLLSMVFLVQPRNIQRMIALIEHEGVILLMGAMNVVLGIILILSYNQWTASWHVVVTLLGWLILLRGLGTLFLPQKTTILMEKLKASPDVLSYMLVVTTILGCFLVYAGFLL